MSTPRVLAPVLTPEGGITRISLANARSLIAAYGLPDRIEIYQGQIDPHRGEHLVEAVWRNGIRHTFNGFAWGYGGEGPRGLETFLGMLNFFAPISIRQIARWPQHGFPALTYVQGEDYGCHS